MVLAAVRSVYTDDAALFPAAGETIWWEIWPLAAIFILVVISINYIGDALRDAFEVRLLER